MNIWNQSPLFKALLPFLTGILTAVYIGYINPVYILITGLPFLIWTTLQILFPEKFVSYVNRWTTGTSTIVLIFCCGYSLSIVNTELNDKRHFSNIKDEECFIAVVREMPVEKESSYKTTLDITAVKANGQWQTTIGRCLVYFKKDSLAARIKYGDEILFDERPSEVSPPSNPSQFDYKQFLAYRNIYHQLYLKSDDWKLLDSHKGNALVETALNLRTRLLSVFKENKIEGQDYAVLSATILGEEDDVDQDTYNAFVASGAIHVLAVSGLHVGIIFLVLNGLLFFMNRKRSTKIIKAIVIILCLAGYALLTGLSPRVLRAAGMICLLVLGTSLERQKNSFNTLAATALILLFFNPFFVMEAGFQFSYLAVIAIIFLYTKIFNWFYVKNRLLRSAWSITSVSIAAQLATFPLGLFYFHQFPNYFILSNLIVVPLATIIIYGGITLLIIAKWSKGALIVGKIVGWSVHALNSVVLKIEHLPYAQINSVSMSAIETCLIYAVIIFFIFFFVRKQQKFLLAAICAFGLILIVQIVQMTEIRKQKQLVVFNIPKASAINFIDGKQSFLIADTLLTNNETSMLYNIRHFWWDRGIVNENLLQDDGTPSVINEESLYIQHNFIQFHDKRIVVITGKTLLNVKHANKIKVDYLIVSKNPTLKIAELMNAFDVQQIIFDSSNSMYHCNKWEEECKAFNIKCYTVSKQGAFVINV